MQKVLRDYKDSDYKQCEDLVNQAWGFDGVFAPAALSDLAKSMYTKGSLLASNYKKVIEVDGKVAGFIFGFNELSVKPGLNILYRISTLWKLIRVKSQKPENKNDLISAIKDHENNRNRIVKRGRSEIVLFVVAKEFQGKGYGKRLWAGFLEQCKKSGVNSIIVETNKFGASSFYERLGFKHLGDFDSPLHEFATEGGQACIYEFLSNKPNNYRAKVTG